ncbi:flagellar assembly protein FliH [Methylomarinovum caldicuralii]|uniref:Flagellar assembly protein FliH n=1 Tax=Methylomarinovum caldicuralii TaxID=438856 RepID=A0AAU9C222_9GAMM|nr:flagellar assembly protein FliH [Methylomarinovum caldicuralii]BCX81643.1 flagellar assembly protein FliH [Methylomarinovum caldicuralii]
MNSSNTEGFSPEELKRASPWRLPEVDNEGDFAEALAKDLAAEPEESADPAAPLPTAEELESMQRQAFEEAAAAGREAGYREGFDKGSQEGYKEGYDKGFQQGYREGREKGEREGREAARAEMEKILAEEAGHLKAVMDCLSQPLAQLDEEVERELVALAMAVAKQLVRRELKTDPGQIVAVVREALSLLPLSQRTVTLAMHPDDAERVRQALRLDQVRVPWEIVEDPLITRGGCRVETDVSRIDATVETRLAAAIATALGGERAEDQAEEKQE